MPLMGLTRKVVLKNARRKELLVIPPLAPRIMAWREASLVWEKSKLNTNSRTTVKKMPLD